MIRYFISYKVSNVNTWAMGNCILERDSKIESGDDIKQIQDELVGADERIDKVVILYYREM